MLMMPPALATKSGAQRMPRAASSAAMSSAASWLFAAPAIAPQRSAGAVSWSSTPPSAQGATRSTSAVSASCGPAQSASSSRARSRLVGSTSASSERRPRRGEPAGQRAADVAEAEDRDPASGQVGRAEHPLARHADGGLHPQRGPRARIARAAAVEREPGDVARALRDDREVLVGRPHVLGGDVAPAELVDGVAEVEQHVAAPRGVERRPVAAEHDHALAAAEREVRDRRLERHRPREAQRVAHRGARVGVSPDPAAAQRRPARRRVHGDDGVEPGAPAPAHEQLLVVEVLEIAVDGGQSLSGPRAAPCGSAYGFGAAAPAGAGAAAGSAADGAATGAAAAPSAGAATGSGATGAGSADGGSASGGLRRGGRLRGRLDPAGRRPGARRPAWTATCPRRAAARDTRPPTGRRRPPGRPSPGPWRRAGRPARKRWDGARPAARRERPAAPGPRAPRPRPRRAPCAPASRRRRRATWAGSRARA